jgi:hypothetical protein
MKVPVSLVRDGKLDRQAAQACIAANLGMPGAGSLMAGRRIGYGQMAVALLGLGVTLVFGLMFAVWYLQNLDRLWAPEADPLVVLAEVWRQLRGALAGMGLFFIGWLWAQGTSLGILRASRGS